MTRPRRRSAAASTVGVAAAFGLLALVIAATGVRPATAGEVATEAGSVDRGAELYVASCATCHGDRGEGVGPWPGIADSGEAAADFQLRTGRMPFAGEPGQQAMPKPPAFDEQEIRDLVAYVATLGDGPSIPTVRVDESLLATGQGLFASNCAPCHGATGNGGAVGGGAIALPLTGSEPLTVAEAMITGPGQMPVFDLPDEERNAIVTYVEYLRDAPSPGGLEIGGIGPVPEGFVAWLVGIGILVPVVYVIGREWDRPRSGS
jgi:ubiquinol-cytochrome c reductase cytochrome c subunit